MPVRMLVVDDAMIIRELIKEAAGEAGFTVVGEGANGQEAIERYRELRPDVVTLDLVMPQFDGLHALEGILGIDPQARVIVVSALEQTTILKDAFRKGAADFITKPFDKKLLIATIENVVNTAVAAG
jgi:two-component system chemotaxis response regulator CheY